MCSAFCIRTDKFYSFVKHYICHIMKKNNNILMWHDFPKNDILKMLCNHKTGKVCILSIDIRTRGYDEK